MKYRTMKVIDCYDMPKDIRESWFSYVQTLGISGNDSYVSFSPKDSEVADWPGAQEVTRWLVSGDIADESVLISYYW